MRKMWYCRVKESVVCALGFTVISNTLSYMFLSHTILNKACVTLQVIDYKEHACMLLVKGRVIDEKVMVLLC